MSYESILIEKGFSVKRNYCGVCGGRKLTNIVYTRGNDKITVWPNKHTFRWTIPVLLKKKGGVHELEAMVSQIA